MVLGLVFYGFHRFLNDVKWISVDFMIPEGSGVSGLTFFGFHRFLFDLCGFHRFLGPEVGRPVASCGLRVWTLLVVWQDQGLDDFDD